jgi:hypothetical protein
MRQNILLGCRYSIAERLEDFRIRPQVNTYFSGFGGLEVACWPLEPKFSGANPAEAVGFFRMKKILSTPSFGRGSKAVGPMS